MTRSLHKHPLWWQVSWMAVVLVGSCPRWRLS